MSEMYVTITRSESGEEPFPFKIGCLLRCEKEPDNPHDSDAIRCSMPVVGTIGYVSNSVGGVAGGTMSAGRIYDKVDKKFYVRALFTTPTKIICRVEDSEPAELKKEMMRQFDDDWDSEPVI